MLEARVHELVVSQLAKIRRLPACLPESPWLCLTFLFQSVNMDAEAARTARESLDLVFHMSNMLDTGLDRHTLSVLIALCDLGLNPEALAAVVKELKREPSSPSSVPPVPSSLP
ncbi:Mitotic-spindle organizing protein 1 [Dillenia turbinata]|uniref:Mitotic-spindle organizing protein 1 n=1 Tax=Dillenia turbinata TaxID=194707 RepID=A0AAN8ZPV3_9MAGN